MRFQFFIQSFSQLDQVFGKEISSIIQDNCALTYLKTNSVECAETISKKLGKATIETSSINQSTDPFKVGANQTTSLLGRELLTANEIINLKYKTIIFPTVSNPIFRDTYLYNDVFPKFKKFEPIFRDESVLKRLTNNYYTVEDMKEKEEDSFNKDIESQFSKIDDDFNKVIANNGKRNRNVFKSNKVLNFGQLLIKKLSFSNLVESKNFIDNNVFQVKINKLTNILEQKEIVSELDDSLRVSMILDKPNKQTIVNVYEGGKECER